MWEMLNKKFILSFITKLIDAIVHYIELFPDTEIREIQGAQFDNLFIDIEKLLERTHHDWTKCMICEGIQVNMAIRFIKSNYLQSRIEGLKKLNELISNHKYKNIRSFERKELIRSIKKHDVITEIIGLRKHSQLLSRAAILIQFLHDQSELDDKTFETLWDITKDNVLRKDVIDIFNKVKFSLNSKELEFLTAQICSIDPKKVTLNELKIIFNAFKFQTEITEALRKNSNVIYDIIFNEKYPIKISGTALKSYSKMLLRLDYQTFKKGIILSCIENIDKHNRNSILSFELIGIIVDHLPILKYKTEIIDNLIEENDLISIFCNNFAWYHKTVKENKELMIDRHNHSMNIEKRLHFLTYVVNTSTHKFPINYYYELWRMLFEDPISIEDTTEYLDFLNDISSNTENVFLYKTHIVF